MKQLLFAACKENGEEPALLRLHFDLARRTLAAGCLEVSLVDTRAVPLTPTYAPILVQAKSFVPYCRDAAGDLLHLASLSLQLAALQSRPPLLVAGVAPEPGPRPPRPSAPSALLDALQQAADTQLPDVSAGAGSREPRERPFTTTFVTNAYQQS